MFYDPSLGLIGNLEKCLRRNQQTRNAVDNAKSEQADTNALTLEISADHEERLCLIELGI